MPADLLLWQQVAGVHQGCNKTRNKAVVGVEDGTGGRVYWVHGEVRDANN